MPPTGQSDWGQNGDTRPEKNYQVDGAILLGQQGMAAKLQCTVLQCSTAVGATDASITIEL